MNNPLPHEITLEEAVVLALTEAFSPQYSNIQPFKEGGTRKVFKADFGLGEETNTRVIKVDLPIANGPRAQRYVSRGYNTRHDLKILIELGEEAAQHHLTQVYDFRDLEPYGIPSIATVEPCFDSQTLEEVVRKKPLTPKEISIVFGQVLDAAQYLNSKNILHRDLSAKNILVQRDRKGIPTRVTDLANARAKSELHEQALPTAGARSIMDPLIVAELTGEERAYTEQSEVYALAHNVYYALTGSYVVDFDPDSHRLSSSDGTSLLATGKIDRRAYEKTVTRSLKNIPRRFRTLVRKGLTLDEKERFESLDEFVEEFNDATKPGIVERVKDNWKNTLAAASAVGILVGAAVGVYTHQTKQQEQLQTELVQAKKFPVKAEMDGKGFEIRNNLVALDPHFYTHMRRDKTPGDAYPEDSFLHVNPGEEIFGSALSREMPGIRQKKLSFLTFPGKIYIEGYPGEVFYSDALRFDQASDFGAEGYYHGSLININTPQDLSPGYHYLVLELYAPPETSTNKNEEELNAQFEFQQPDKILARKRIPLVVGDTNPEKIAVPHFFAVSGLQDYLSFAYIQDVGKSSYISTGGESHVIARIPEKNFARNLGRCSYDPQSKNRIDVSGGYVGLPDSDYRTPHSPVIMDLITYGSDEKLLGYTFVPLEKRLYDPASPVATYFWELGIPGREFSDSLIERRKSIEAYSHEKDAK